MSDNRYREVLAGVWAKSPRTGAKQGESLIGHTSVVVARLNSLYLLFPHLAERVGEPRLWHRAFWACALHDLGKSAFGFQAQLRPGGKPWGQRHEVLSLAFLEWIFPEDPHNDRAWIAAGIASHHRDLHNILTLYSSSDDPEDSEDDPVRSLTQQIDDSLIEALAVWVTVDPCLWAQRSRVPGVEARPIPLVQQPIEDFRNHAAVRIRRALTAYKRLVRRLEQEPASSSENLAALALRGLVLLADHTASAHVTPMSSPFVNVQKTVECLGFGSFETLYTHQRDASACSGHALLVAPTGSGKTEAALLWAARQQEQGGIGGRIFYLLPYQASLNAMHARISRPFPNTVALQHSRALQALYRSLLEKGYTQDTAEQVARHEQSLARLHYHPVRVLTPYQLLRGAFKLKGYEALCTDATEGLFIFDEIHAYEPRRLGMILGMVAYLRRYLGARFLVMSATFPTVLRKALLEVLGDVTPLNAGETLYKDFTRHTLRLVEGTITDQLILERVAHRAQGGESVLVVCNTVRTATAVYDDLQARLARTTTLVELLHGRFNARDRFRKEQQILNRMGTRQRDRTITPVVLVATQVVEVSLDIDFDTLFTEPAPLEALIQRFGRVNRCRRYPTCDVHILSAPLDGQGIYTEAYVTGALRALGTHVNQAIDEFQIGPWLDRIYAESVGEGWAREIKRSRDEFTDACLANLRAFQSSSDLAERFDEMFDGTEVLPRSLQKEYEGLSKAEPLRASELFVPISLGQLRRLRRERRVVSTPKEGPWVVDAPYSPQLGLDLRKKQN